MSSSDVAAGRHVGDFASAPRQTCLAMRCALAMVIAIKIFKKNLSSKILSVKTFNFLAFTTKKKKKFAKKPAGQIAQIPLFLTFSLFLTLGVLWFPI